MRVFVKAMLAASAVVAMSTALSADAAREGTTDALRKAETRGLNAVPSQRLSGMLKAPETAQEVTYSRGWLASEPKPTGNANWQCLTEALYFEARGETLKGQFAVAEVIVNRVKSSRFPDNLCAVINQGTGKKYQCQFTFTCDGNPETINERGAYEQVGKVARAVMDGKAPELTSGATHYHTTAVNPRWSRVYTRTARIGVHIFYRHTYRSASN